METVTRTTGAALFRGLTDAVALVGGADAQIVKASEQGRPAGMATQTQTAALQCIGQHRATRFTMVQFMAG